MSQDFLKRASKFLSYILRHRPESIGLTLDAQGWADIHDLIEKASQAETPVFLNVETIATVVAENDKQRFMLSSDGKKIRAVQGHSIEVQLPLQPLEPPDILYHGTATRFLASILEQGLTPRQRQFVHLSFDKLTAMNVGQRYGKPVILSVRSILMYRDGYVFFRAENGVWLTKEVPAQYLALFVEP